MCRLLLDAAADRHNPLGLREIDRLTGLLERRLRLLADAPCTSIVRARVPARALARRIGPKRPDLKRHEMGRGALRHHIRGQFALEHRTREHHLAAGRLDGRDVGDERAVEAGGDFGAKSRV